MSGYDDFALGFHLGAEGQIWVSASSRLGHVHGVTSVGPGRDVLADVFEELYDLLDAIRFAEPFDAAPCSRTLGDIAFGEPIVRELFQAARGAAADRGRQLLVRVQASPHLAALPWELLPDPSSNVGGAGGPLRHLTLAPDVHVVRLSRGRTYPVRTEPVEPPLNLLVVLSSPMGERAGDDALTFDIYEAKRNLLDELVALEDAGWLNVDVEDQPTLDNLRRRVGSKRRGYHLLHYLGHAEPDLLLLEDQRGRRRDVTGSELVDWLRSCPDLRLVTFAGCETARPGGDPTLADSTDWQTLLSLAERAAQGSSPVVLGMQAVLPFRTEWLLTRSLYQALASGNTVVDALRLAREAVRSDEQARRGLLDWAIPALFMNSAEPAPLLEKRGTPPVATRRRSNVAKIEPPAAAAGLIGRDVPLRQAVEVLAGRTRERLLLIAGATDARASELVDRALDEIDGQVSDILSVPFHVLLDRAEASSFLAEGESTAEEVVRANVCAAVSQLLQRTDGSLRERRPNWTLRRWWAALSDDLAGRRAVLAIDRMNVLALSRPPLIGLARAWLTNAFPATGEDGADSAARILAFVEQLRDPSAAKKKTHERLADFDRFIGVPAENSLARELLIEQAEDLLNERLGLTVGVPASAPSSGDQSVDEHRAQFAETRRATEAVADTLIKLVRRAPGCRVALVVDEIPDGMLDEIDDLVFPMRLGETTWPEMWRWLRRNLPGLVRFGEDRLKVVWRKYLGSNLEQWLELERRVVSAQGFTGKTSPGDGIDGVEDPETGLERLAHQITIRRVRRRRPSEDPPPSGVGRRRDRPLVVAAGASFTDAADPASKWRLSFATFHARLNALAEEHGIGGRVTTAAVDKQDALAVLVPVESPFVDGGASTSDLIRWYAEVGKARPDIVLLDFGGGEVSESDRLARRAYFPIHHTLQIAAGGNSNSDDAQWPAWDEDVLAVGALDEKGDISEFSSRNAKRRKPDIFASDVFDPDNPRAGTSYAAAYVVVAAILVWTLLPERTPQGLRRFLTEASEPLGRGRARWPRGLDLDEAVAAARRERVLSTLQRGRASLQAVVAMTGLNWFWAENTLDELVSDNLVAVSPAGRDVVYELLDHGVVKVR